MRRINSTYSRNISFGSFTINPGETKNFPDELTIPEEWKAHLHLIDERTDEESLALEPTVEESTKKLVKKKTPEVNQ